MTSTWNNLGTTEARSVRLVPEALRYVEGVIDKTLTHRALAHLEHPQMRMVVCLRQWLNDAGYVTTSEEVATCLACHASLLR